MRHPTPILIVAIVTKRASVPKEALQGHAQHRSAGARRVFIELIERAALVEFSRPF